MVDNITIRLATVDDIDFIVEAIKEAEKSGTDNLGIANLFGLSDNEISKYLREILEEEIDGCEFSLESFLVAEVNGILAAAVAGWIEGENSSELTSAMLKANLLGYILPKKCIEKSIALSDMLDEIKLDRTLGNLQIEYVYCNPKFRRKGLTKALIFKHIENKRANRAEVQVFANNDRAIALYKSLGFEICKEVVSYNKEITKIFPCNKKILFIKNY